MTGTFYVIVTLPFRLHGTRRRPQRRCCPTRS